MKIKILRQKAPDTEPYWESLVYTGDREISVAGLLDVLVKQVSDNGFIQQELNAVDDDCKRRSKKNWEKRIECILRLVLPLPIVSNKPPSSVSKI